MKQTNRTHAVLRLGTGAMVVAATWLCVACGSKESEQAGEAGAVVVKETTVGASGLTADYNYSGTVEEDNATLLSFATGGTITSIRVKVGDRVGKGQLVATLDPTALKNNHAIALAAKQQAEDAYQRMKQLHDKGSLPDMKWVEVQSQLAQATSAEQIARKQLADCNLYAPVSGTVSDKLAEQGQNTAAGYPVLKVVTTSAMNVRVSVPESEIGKVSTGQHADILVPALSDRHFSGRVCEKGVVADPVSRSYSVKVRIEGADASLLPGMVTKVSMDERTSSDAIVIPARLVQLGDDNTAFVWIDNGGKAERRTVELGEFTAQGVRVVGGLRQGDRLIVEGQQKVCNGTKVTPTH